MKLFVLMATGLHGGGGAERDGEPVILEAFDTMHCSFLNVAITDCYGGGNYAFNESCVKTDQNVLLTIFH